MQLVGPGQYEAVRRSIRTDFDSGDIPNELIEIDSYAGEAEREVRTLDPNVDTYTGTNLRRSILAATYLCAALICDAMPNLTSENFQGAYTWRIEGWNQAERAAALRWLAFEQIAANLGVDPLTLVGALPVFTLADAGPVGAERGQFPSIGSGAGNTGAGSLGWW